MSYDTAVPVLTHGRLMQRSKRRDRPAPPIDEQTVAECMLLLAVIAKTQPRRVAEFFSLTGSRHEKIAFLLRHGHFERWTLQ